jgi:hypothetical protein
MLIFGIFLEYSDEKGERFMKERFRQYLSTPMSRYLALAFLVIGATASAAQIFSDVQSLSGSEETDDSETLLDANFDETFSEILSQTRFGGPCSYTGFSSPMSADEFPSETRWRFEGSGENIAFDYSCSEGGYLANINVANLQFSTPELITISGTLQGADAEIVQVRLLGVNESSETCWDMNVDITVIEDGGSRSFTGELLVSEESGWSLDCYLVRPVEVTAVSSAKAITPNVELSKLIDVTLRSNVPSNCYFIAAVLTNGQIEGETGALHKYINANYLSKDGHFGGFGPSSDSYEFDPALSIKLPLYPEWVYTCELNGTIREFNFGGMDWPDSGLYLETPEKNQVNILYTPWSEAPVQVRFSIEFLDTDLRSCGVWSFEDKTTNDGVGGWHGLSLSQRSLPNLDRALCPIISLKEYREEIL